MQKKPAKAKLSLDQIIANQNNQSGRIKLSPEVVDIMLNVIQLLQDELQNPPTIMQICNRLRRDQDKVMVLNNIFIHKWAVSALFFTGKVYSSRCQTYYSLTRYNQEFMTYKETFDKRYKELGYVTDHRALIRPGEKTKTVEFKELWDMLRSSNEVELEKMKWVFEQEDMYLKINSKVTPSTYGQKISCSTYPRCGNSFFRNYFQLITGTATGSDMPLEFNPDMQLVNNKAEEIQDESVWLYKSHDPLKIPGVKIAKANKVLCCVRNPFDTIASFTIFMLTNNQGGQMINKFSQWPEKWNEIVKCQAENIKRYHDAIFDVRARQVPHFFIRYEDLFTNPQETLEQVFCFFLELESVEGTNIQRRIRDVVALGHSATVSYPQKTEAVDTKAAVKKIIFNRNIDQFTCEQQSFVNSELSRFNNFFGYSGVSDHSMSPEDLLQHQQTSFKFALYDSVPESSSDPSYSSFNDQVMIDILYPHEVKTLAVNYENTIDFKRVDCSDIQKEVVEKVIKWEKN